MDNILKRFGIRIRLDFSNHDLRRTCGRIMHYAGLAIEEIPSIFGQEDTKTT